MDFAGFRQKRPHRMGWRADGKSPMQQGQNEDRNLFMRNSEHVKTFSVIRGLVTKFKPATRLISEITGEKTAKSKSWANGPRNASDALIGLAPALRKVGIDAVRGVKTPGKGSKRLIVISWIPGFGVEGNPHFDAG